MISLMNYFEAVQLILQAMRVAATSATLIDHIYTSCPVHIRLSGVIPIEISDHYLVYVVHKHCKGFLASSTHHKPLSLYDPLTFSFTFANRTVFTPLLFNLLVTQAITINFIGYLYLYSGCLIHYLSNMLEKS